MKIIYVNFGVKNYLKEDHRSYNMQLMRCEKKAWNNLKLVQEFEPLTSVILVSERSRVETAMIFL